MGGAGTGKSLIIKSLLYKYQKEILVGSYMVASSNLVGGQTLHSLLKLPIYAFGHKDLSDDQVQELKKKF